MCVCTHACRCTYIYIYMNDYFYKFIMQNHPIYFIMCKHLENPLIPIPNKFGLIISTFQL